MCVSQLWWRLLRSINEQFSRFVLLKLTLLLKRFCELFTDTPYYYSKNLNSSLAVTAVCEFIWSACLVIKTCLRCCGSLWGKLCMLQCLSSCKSLPGSSPETVLLRAMGSCSCFHGQCCKGSSHLGWSSLRNLIKRSEGFFFSKQISYGGGRGTGCLVTVISSSSEIVPVCYICFYKVH